LETLLSAAAAAIKLGTRSSPPPRSKTYIIREFIPNQKAHTTRNMQEQNKMHFFLMQEDTHPIQACSEEQLTGLPQSLKTAS
jgi:hypothetical protein